jgi:tetratricopeptide (TPR) repeat protein
MRLFLTIGCIVSALTLVASGCGRKVEIVKIRYVEPAERHQPLAAAMPPVDFVLSGELAEAGHFDTAYDHYRHRQLDRCREFLEMALAEDPGHWRAHYLLAVLAFQEQNYVRAERCFLAALRFSDAPDQSRAAIYAALGLTMERLGKPGFAKQHYLTALKLDPSSTVAGDGLDRLTALSSLEGE